VISRLPTGAKLFLILSVALLPLALIAVIAAYQTTRIADLESRTRLSVAATEASRTLAIELHGDVAVLRSAVTEIEADPANTASCARIQGVFAQGAAQGVVFAIRDSAGQLRCGTPIALDIASAASGVVVAIVPGRGLTLSVAGIRGQSRATAYFPASFLAQIGQPSGFASPYGAALHLDDDVLTLRALDASPIERLDRLGVPIGIEDLTLYMTAASAPITSAVLVAMLLPILMWAAAAGIGWFVVDRLLIRALRALRRTVGTYQPGTVFDPHAIGPAPAQEIRELGDTFRNLSLTLLAHEDDLAEGLVRQTKLTREVHHRVKNNLQVIASLINFHARSAAGPDVAAAYATIQRRVDALAVVHRNHFAELEVNRGLSLRSVIGELAANIRATAPDHSSRLGITLEVEPFLVSQDVAVAVAFLATEIVELAMSTQPAAQIRISVASTDSDDRAVVRISSPALIEGDELRSLLQTRYGRVIEGLSRQLRSKLHQDPLVGAFEIVIAVVGRD